MFFEYQTGYQVSDLLGQIRSERNVARGMGLRPRRNLLDHMEKLVCHFFGCNYIGVPVIEPTNGMPPSLIKMKMANEARNVLSALDTLGSGSQRDSDVDEGERSLQAKNKSENTPPKKIYKYPCHVCKREYSHIANHLKHAHKLKPKQINQAKRERKQAKESNRQNTTMKRSLKSCPMKGCSWRGRRFDYHLPKIHSIKKGSDKYNSLIHSVAGGES